MNNNQFYLLIIGAPDGNQLKSLEDKAGELGTVRKIMAGTYILAIEGGAVRPADIRNYIIKDSDGDTNTMVIKLDDYFTCAWSLRRENSEYVRSTFKRIYGED